MAEGAPQTRVAGFSLAELLVALVFTMVLMAGMANVYKASLSAFYTSGESLSSSRRNRMSVDLLVEDLNQAGMFLTDLSVPPAVSEAMPTFLILPNMHVDGHGDNDPDTTDELYFYVDQPLSFEGTLTAASTQRAAAELVAAETALTNADNTYTFSCDSVTYANQVAAGQVLILKDTWEAVSILSVTSSGSSAMVVTGPMPNASITGSGAAAPASRVRHLAGSRVVPIQPAQMVRYRIQMLQLDPSSTTGIPCLVRDQGGYSSTAFTASQAQQIIAENVAGFAVYLSSDGGQTWAGLDPATGAKALYSGYDAGWDTGIRTELDAQLMTSGRPGAKTTRIGPTWFRTIPVLVRADITTRTATRRSEYATNPTVAAFRLQTQSLILVPRHSGLVLN